MNERFLLILWSMGYYDLWRYYFHLFSSPHGSSFSS